MGVADEEVGGAAHAADEESGDLPEDEGDQQGDEDLGQAVLEEGDEIVVPAQLEAVESAFVLWNRVGKRHDGVARKKLALLFRG